MSLFGATTSTAIQTSARVNRDFQLQAFDFSLDPGTGPIKVHGDVEAKRLILAVTTSAGVRVEQRDLIDRPELTLNMSRRLASGGLVAGRRHQWMLFDPATLRNAPVTLDVGKREIVRVGTTPVPAFRVSMEFSGIQTTAWITDTGEVVREESPMGLITVKETADRAQAMAVPANIQSDLYEAAAIVPVGRQRIDDPRDVRRLRVRLEGGELGDPDLDGGSQRVAGNVFEMLDPESLRPGPRDGSAARYLEPEAFIESDDPGIRAEAERAVRGSTSPRVRAERLTRYVNQMLEKKPTISLPSAREVLRTKVGDCNEHTALYVAMARASGIPARIAVGLVYLRGAFYYHAWPEVYLEEPTGGLWLPVDPTLNEFPADATHLRLARGGLEKQAAILPLVGKLKMTVLDLEVAPNSTPIIVGRQPAPALDALQLPVPRRQTSCCVCP